MAAVVTVPPVAKFGGPHQPAQGPVAQQAGQGDGGERQARPAGTAPRPRTPRTPRAPRAPRAGAGVIGTPHSLAVLAAAVVEEPLDAAQAGGVVHGGLRRAEARVVAQPPRG